MFKECLVCKKIFKTFPSRIKTGGGKYCSQECTGKHSTGKPINVRENNPNWRKLGEQNHAWRGNNITYKHLHTWIIKQLGVPRLCSNCGTTTAKRFEWANISGEYLRDVSDFKRLCCKCHRVFDVDSYPKGENKSNAKLSEKDVMRIRKLYMAEKYSQHKLGENFGVCAMTINRIILRKIWKHV